MGTELEINAGLARLKVSLGEFVAILEQIAGLEQQKEARDALKNAIAEIRKSCDTVVDVFTPLYALTSQAKFSGSFGDLYADFKNSYLKNVGAVRTHCDIVKSHLSDMLRGQHWMSYIPLLKHSYGRLGSLCDTWLFQDDNLAHQMDNFLGEIDKFYREIAELQQSDETAAFTTLRSALQQYEDDFLSLRKKLHALDAVGNRL
jgi:hypothetical protein